MLPERRTRQIATSSSRRDSTGSSNPMKRRFEELGKYRKTFINVVQARDDRESAER
jgi:hypothetical protein